MPIKMILTKRNVAISAFLLVTLTLLFTLTGCSKQEEQIQPVPTGTEQDNQKQEGEVSLTVTTAPVTDQPVDDTEIPTKENVEIPEDAIELSFAGRPLLEYLKEINGKTVKINGYMSLASPTDGCFIYLVDAPYVDVPFTYDNSEMLVDTIEAYPKEGESFGYSVQAITVAGTLEVFEGEAMTDEYGYGITYRIKDAVFIIMDEEDMDPSIRNWQKISGMGTIDALYGMYNYLWLVVDWYEFYYEGGEDEEGNRIDGYFLYPDDLNWYINENLPYVTEVEDYFGALENMLEYADTDGDLLPLMENLDKCIGLYNKAVAAIENEEWTTEEGYWEEIGNEETRYYMNDGEAFIEEFGTLWSEFGEFIDGYRMK